MQARRRKNNLDPQMIVELHDAFQHDLFSDRLLDWMLANDPKEYMATIPQEMTSIWIPCSQFNKKFGKQENYRTKLMAIMEALPSHVTKINLDGLVKIPSLGDNKEDVMLYQFDLKKVLDAIKGKKQIIRGVETRVCKGAPHVTEINLCSNKLLEVCIKHYEMLMGGISHRVDTLDLSRNIDLTKLPEKDQLTKAKELKEKMQALPSGVKYLDLSWNFLSKLGGKGFLTMMSGLQDKHELDTVYLSGNYLKELDQVILDELQDIMPDVKFDLSMDYISDSENESDMDISASNDEEYLSDDETSDLQAYTYAGNSTSSSTSSPRATHGFFSSSSSNSSPNRRVSNGDDNMDLSRTYDSEGFKRLLGK